MPFTAAQIACAAAITADTLAASAAAEQRTITFLQDQSMRVQDAIVLRPPMAHTLHPGDCQSCGSQEFRTWRGTSVCAYCRSTAQAVAPRPARVSDDYSTILAEEKIRMLQEYQRFAVRDIQKQYERITTD